MLTWNIHLIKPKPSLTGDKVLDTRGAVYLYDQMISAPPKKIHVWHANTRDESFWYSAKWSVFQVSKMCGGIHTFHTMSHMVFCCSKVCFTNQFSSWNRCYWMAIFNMAFGRLDAQSLCCSVETLKDWRPWLNFIVTVMGCYMMGDGFYIAHNTIKKLWYVL